MVSPIETQPQASETLYAPVLDGEYSVRTVGEDPAKQFCTKFGSITLRTLAVEVARQYENQAPRTTWYEALAAYRTDTDAPDQQLYPLVSYSNALLTTARKPNTATNRYFLNPVYEGFSAVNVSVKQKPKRHPFDVLRRLMPHTLSLEEMGDDELVVTDHLAYTLGLGSEPDGNGVRPLNKNGYSRGVELSFVEVARAGLHGLIVIRTQGRGPGPINSVHLKKVIGSIKKEAKEEGKVILNQVINEPRHAVNNYLNVVTHRVDEIASYIGDAEPLLRGDVARAMPHINPKMRGFVSLFSNDPFGRHKDYVVHFEEFEQMMEENTYYSRIAPDFRLIHRSGAHMSGMDKAEVKFDRLEWAAEREFLDGQTLDSTSYNE